MELVIKSVDDALDIFFGADNVNYDDLERIIFEEWASTHIKIEGGFHSEINGPFLAAYAHINEDFLRLFALTRYDNGDIRSLRQDDLNELEYKVKVKEGSSDIVDNAFKVLEKVSSELVGKMSGTEVVITVVGLAIIIAGAYGFGAFLESRKKIRLEEIRSQERKEAIEALSFANSAQVDNFNKVIAIMGARNEISKRALAAGLASNENLLKAAAQTPETVIEGHHVSSAEAKELLGQTRRRAFNKIIEQDMRVVDLNTSDPISTRVVIENPEDLKQLRVSFRDRMIDEGARAILLRALDKRGLAWFRLSIRQVDDDVVSVEIIEVKESSGDSAPPAPAASAPIVRGH